MANAMVGQRLQGGQGQVGAPQLHLPGLVDEIEIPIWAGRIYRIRDISLHLFQGVAEQPQR